MTWPMGRVYSLFLTTSHMDTINIFFEKLVAICHFGVHLLRGQNISCHKRFKF